MYKSILLPCMIFFISLLPAKATGQGQQGRQEAKYTIKSPLVYEDIWDLPPYTFLNKDGEPMGYNIDLIKIILKRLDIPYIIKLRSTSEAYNDLKEGKSDLMLGMRTKYHSQFGKYGNSVVALFTHGVAHPKKETVDINSLEDLKGHKVIMQNNSVSHRMVMEAGLEDCAVPHHDIGNAIIKAAAKDSGQVLWNSLSLKFTLRRNNLDNFTITPIVMPNGEYHFMSNDEDLLRRVDSVYEAMVYDEELQPIRNKWFYPEVQSTGIPSFVWYIVWALGIVAVLLLIYNRIYHYRMGKIKRISNIQSKRLALYLHSGKIQIWTYDVERDVFATFTNDGDKDEEYNRLSFSVFFNEEDYNKIYAAIEDIKTGNEDVKPVLVRCHKPGTPDNEHYFYVKISVFQREGNSPSLLLGTQQNVNAEQERHINMQNLLLRNDVVFNSLKMDMAYFDSNGILTDINDSTCDTFKITDKQMFLDRKIPLTFIPAYAEIDIYNMSSFHASLIVKGNRGMADADNVFSIIPEKVEYYEHMLTPIFNSEHGLTGILFIGRDITSQVRSIRNELKNEKYIVDQTKRRNEYIKNINNALEVSRIWLISYYPKTKIMEVMYNLDEPPMRLSQIKCAMLTDECDKHRVASLINKMDKCMTDRFDIKLKTVFHDKEGKDIYLQFNGISIQDENGNVDHYFGLGRDVSMIEETDRLLKQEMDKAREAETVKTAFLKNISYEVRTPLNSVVGFAEMFNIEHSKEDEEVFMSEIRNNSSALLKLINDILFLSKLDANMVEITKSPTDFACEFMAYCITGWSHELKDGVEMIVDSPYEQLVVDIDSNHVGQVIEMLATNSAHFTSSGMLRGRYGYYHGNLEICLEDTGAGIEKKNLDTMFNNMNVAENMDQSAIRLRMQICKKLVEKMGGSMNVDSEPGKGVTVWIRIPCEATVVKKKDIRI